MNMVLKKEIFIVLFLTIKIIANCQTDPCLKLVTSAEDYKIQERVLLTLDQDFYLAGESINFFSLTFDAALQIPIEFSSVLYVELYNQDNNVISAKKFLLKQGECVNSLTVPRKLETGYYYVRAYTNYLKNFGPSAFFTKKIRIVNPFYKIKYQDDANVVPDKMKLSISAEGGKILYGVENKIAFHLINSNDSVFVLLYKNDSVVAKVNSKNGFGIFNINPTVNNKYRIEAVSLKKERAVVELKNMVQSGVICKLDSVDKKNAYLKVIAKNEDKFPISVFVENNTILYKYSDTIDKPEALLKIELPVGLNKIILKNCNQEEVSERLIYIKPQTKLEITAKLDKAKVLPGDSVTLHISTNVNDSIHYVVALNLGTQNTSSGLKELIESTLYTSSIPTFTGDASFSDLQYVCSNPETVNDYILKFQNAESTNPSLENVNYLPEISNDIVSGTVKRLSDQSSATNKRIYISFVDSICWISRSRTDGSGRFVAALPVDYQGSNLIVTVKDTTDNYIVKLDDEFYPDFLKLTKEHYYPDPSLKKIIESRMINLQVNDAYSELHKNTKPPRPTLRFYGYPDSEHKFKKYLVPNLEEFISEIEQKATIVRKEKKVNIRVINKTGRNIIGDNPLIIFDGIPLLNADKIVSIPSDKLESIRIVSNKFFFGSEVFDGIVDITSNTKSFDLVDMDKNSMRVLFCPIITAKDNYMQQNSYFPRYISDIYFEKINSVSGSANIAINLPQNTGNYSLSVFGYTKNGECGSVLEPNALVIGR